MTSLLEPEETNSFLKRILSGDLAERLESAKAGLIGAIAAAAGFALTLWLHQVWLRPAFSLSGPRQLAVAYAPGVSLAIVLLSGFLFGVTYRYVIRRDANPHLKSGAVLAFGLVRGLAQIEPGLQTEPNLLLLGLMGLESLLLFVSARLAIDWAISRTWLHPFPRLPRE